MKTTLSLLLCAVGLVAVNTACYHTMEGRSKVGVPFVQDKIVSRYERPVPDVFNAAKAVLSNKGQLNDENLINNTLGAKVDNNTVWVRVEAVQPHITQITTQVRTKGGSGNLQLASQLDKEIALRLQAQ